MLEYEWCNPAILLTAEEMNQEPDQTHQMFNQYISNDPTRAGNLRAQNFPHNLNTNQTQISLQDQPMIESRNYGLTQHYPSPASLSTPGRLHAGISSHNQFFMDMGNKGLFLQDIVKSEEDFPARIGLNLGGRTYFSSEDDFVNRLYRLNPPISPGLNSPRCQAEGCNADLTHSKHYHRRHKVCEFHSKAPTVIAAGLTQRFCQQCSRFHLLTEFDQEKRSCRKRLADHNRRRRKPQLQNLQSALQEIQNPQNSGTGDPAKSSPESGSSLSEPTDAVSVTVAVSPPQMNLHYPCQSLWTRYQPSSSSTSQAMDFPSVRNFWSYVRQIPGAEWDEEQ